MERQPAFPQVTDDDRFYFGIAHELGQAWELSGVLTDLPVPVRSDAVMAVVGYFQDIVADAGLWRTFTLHHCRCHGVPLPHYGRPDDYVDYELNLADVQCVLWFTLNAYVAIDAHDTRLTALAQVMHRVLEQAYDEAPACLELRLLMDVDLTDEREAQAAYRQAYWLFWKSYLLRPWAVAAAEACRQEAQEIIASCHGADATPLLHDLNDRIMASTPAGPLPMKVGEWMTLMAEQRQ